MQLRKKQSNLVLLKAYIVDAKEEFVKDYVWPTVKAGAVYEGKYLLGTSFARTFNR